MIFEKRSIAPIEPTTYRGNIMERKIELTDLVKRIEQWAVNLGLNENSNPLQQTLKYYEEVGELAKAIQQHNVIEVMDGIGDSVVVGAVLGSQMRKFSTSSEYDEMPLVGIGQEYSPVQPIFPVEFLSRKFYEYIQNLQRYVNYCVDAYAQEQHGHYLFHFYGAFLKSAQQLSECMGLDFNKCVKMAYTTIHFRSGEIIDGVFVKRKPDATIKISTKKLELPVDKLIEEIVEYAQQNKIKFFKVEFDLEIDDYTH